MVDGDGDGTATVDMGAYEFQTYALTVSLAGSGSGTVSGDGINCNTSTAADCSGTYPKGTIINLTATADPGSTFSGWGGACTGSGGCTLTMTEAKAVTATFDSLDIYLPIISR